MKIVVSKRKVGMDENGLNSVTSSFGKYVRSGCTTALNVVPWETDGESCLSSASTLFVTKPVNVTGAPVPNIVANHAEKLENFNGQNFKRWQRKMFFYLGTLNLAWFLKMNCHRRWKPPKEDKPLMPRCFEAFRNLMCHNYALYGLNDIKTEAMRESDLRLEKWRD
ncbi:hypothetical protein Tco_0663384 [Tanacetum coccineum]